MKNQLISKYREILTQSNISKISSIKISIDTLALMCANTELELLESSYTITENITGYVIQNTLNGLGV